MDERKTDGGGSSRRDGFVEPPCAFKVRPLRWLTAHGPLFIVLAYALVEFFTGFWRSRPEVGHDLGRGLFVQTTVKK